MLPASCKEVDKKKQSERFTDSLGYSNRESPDKEPERYEEQVY